MTLIRPAPCRVGVWCWERLDWRLNWFDATLQLAHLLHATLQTVQRFNCKAEDFWRWEVSFMRRQWWPEFKMEFIGEALCCIILLRLVHGRLPPLCSQWRSVALETEDGLQGILQPVAGEEWTFSMLGRTAWTSSITHSCACVVGELDESWAPAPFFISWCGWDTGETVSENLLGLYVDSMSLADQWGRKGWASQDDMPADKPTWLSQSIIRIPY